MDGLKRDLWDLYCQEKSVDVSKNQPYSVGLWEERYVGYYSGLGGFVKALWEADGCVVNQEILATLDISTVYNKYKKDYVFIVLSQVDLEEWFGWKGDEGKTQTVDCSFVFVFKRTKYTVCKIEVAKEDAAINQLELGGYHGITASSLK